MSADSVAVLRDFASAYSPDSENGKALREAIAALEAQGEARLVGYMDANADFLLPKPDGCVLASHVDVLLVREPRDQFTQPLYTAPGGVGDAVTEELLRRAWSLLDIECPNHPLVDELQAALASRTGKGEANGR